jgi:hypothetical protein
VRGGDGEGQALSADLCKEDGTLIDDDERQRFVAWTFDSELTLLEEHLGNFDRNAPNADLSTARLQLDLLECYADNVEDAPSKRIPTFLGHDMAWWAKMCRAFLMNWQGQMRDERERRDGLPVEPTLLDRLGIRDAVLAYIADMKAWERQRTTARRKARRDGRNWVGEMLPKVR